MLVAAVWGKHWENEAVVYILSRVSGHRSGYQTREYHIITTKELLPIVLAAAVWGKHWENKSILSLR